MTLSELQTRTLQRLDEDTGGAGYFSGSDVTSALNQGQRLFALLTLCLETQDTQSLDAAVSTYRMLTVFPNWLLPLRVRVNGTGGAKLAYASLTEFDALNPAWQNEAGTPERYAHLGFDFLAIHPRPADGSVELDWTYARCPAWLAAPNGSPEIAAEHHPGLVDYAIPALRAKEGGQPFIDSLKYFDRFLEGAQRYAEFIRAKNRTARYDHEPFEMKAFDRSRAIEGLRAKGR